MHEMATCGMTLAVATAGLFLAGAGDAMADAAPMAGSGGAVLSGTSVQIPVLAGLNGCATTATVGGISSPSGNCSITAPTGAAPVTLAGAVGSGNVLGLPVTFLTNACETTAAIAAQADSGAGTLCAADAGAPASAAA